MADEPIPAAEESIEDFIKSANAVELATLRGEAPLEPPPPADELTAADLEETPKVEEPKPAKKTDGRTLEGRRQKIYAQVEELTAQRHETQREVESTKAELAKLREELAKLNVPRPHAPAPQQPLAARDEDPKPKLEDFKEKDDPYTEWQDAKAVWYGRQEALRLHRLTLAQNSQEREHSEWTAKVTEAEKTSPGLIAKIQAATNVQIHTDIIPYIKRHPMGAQITGYIIDHPVDAQRLLTLNPVEQIGQIGEIVGELKAQAAAAKSGSAPQARPVSSAKAPIQPLGTTPVAASAEADDDEPVEAHIRRYNAVDRKAGRL